MVFSKVTSSTGCGLVERKMESGIGTMEVALATVIGTPARNQVTMACVVTCTRIIVGMMPNVTELVCVSQNLYAKQHVSIYKGINDDIKDYIYLKK